MCHAVKLCNEQITKEMLCDNVKLQSTGTVKLQSLQYILTITLMQCQCQKKTAVNIKNVAVHIKESMTASST